MRYQYGVLFPRNQYCQVCSPGKEPHIRNARSRVGEKKARRIRVRSLAGLVLYKVKNLAALGLDIVLRQVAILDEERMRCLAVVTLDSIHLACLFTYLRDT
jgi:hypothetical protein